MVYREKFGSKIFINSSKKKGLCKFSAKYCMALYFRRNPTIILGSNRKYVLNSFPIWYKLKDL